MGECATEAAQCPDEEVIARLNRGEGILEPRTVVLCVAGPVGPRLPGSHAGRAPRMTLYVGRLGLGLTGDPHGAQQHRRKTPCGTLSSIPSIRQCFSRRL